MKNRSQSRVTRFPPLANGNLYVSCKTIPQSTRNARKPTSALRLDPTRTLTLRRQFITRLRKQFARLKAKIVDLVVKEDAFGLSGETRNTLTENCQPGQIRDEKGRCGPGIGVEIPREQMPQIPGDMKQEFITFCNSHGVQATRKIVGASDLSPTQSRFRQERVDAIPDGLDDPIIVSEDYYILDGTHRWVKAWQKDENGPVKVLMIALSLQEALKLMRAFPAVKYAANNYQPATLNGATSYFSQESLDQGLIEVPDIRQHDHYSCGAAAAMCVGKYWGVGPNSIGEWKEKLGTDVEQSTNPEAIAHYLETLDLQVETYYNLSLADLKEYWNKGWPVITPVQDYGPEVPGKAEFSYGHYLTVIGVSLGYVFCQDSSADNVLKGEGSDAAPGKVMIEEQDFLDLWHDRDIHGDEYIRFGIAVGPRLTQNAGDPEGRWITIQGTHVLVKDGKIVQGPDHLKGLKPYEAQLAHAKHQMETFKPPQQKETPSTVDLPSQKSEENKSSSKSPKEAIKRVTQEHIDEKGVGATFDSIHSKAKQLYPKMSKEDFRVAVTELHREGSFKLGGWGRMHSDLPDPELAVHLGGEKTRGAKDKVDRTKAPDLDEVGRLMYALHPSSGTKNSNPNHDFLGRFADSVNEAAKESPTGKFGENKTFISHVHKQYLDNQQAQGKTGIQDLGKFKENLVKASRAGYIKMARADLPQIMNPKDIDESSTKDAYSHNHFIVHNANPNHDEHGRFTNAFGVEYEHDKLSTKDRQALRKRRGEENVKEISEVTKKFEKEHPGAKTPETMIKGKFYFGSGGDHGLINGILRGKPVKVYKVGEQIHQYLKEDQAGHDRSVKMRDKADKAIKTMREEFAKSPIKTNGETVYRRAGEYMSPMKVGDTFSDKGFMSTTLSPKFGTEAKQVLVIKTPKGEPVLYHAKEAELLFKENTRLKITKIEDHSKTHGTTYYHCAMEKSGKQTHNELVVNQHYEVNLDEDIQEPTTNENPNHDEQGRFASGPSTGLVSQLKAAGAAVGHIEHLAKTYVSDKIGRAVLKLPKAMQSGVHAAFSVGKVGTAAAFVTWKTGQALAEKIAKEKGATEEEARSLRGVLSSIDMATFKPLSYGLHISGMSTVTLGLTSLIPPATASYLAYSTAKNPLATARAAGKLVKETAQALHKKLYVTLNSPEAWGNLLYDSLKQHNFSDWYIALLSTAMDGTQDCYEALAIANKAYDTQGSITTNVGRWSFNTSSEQIDKFQNWLREQFDADLTGDTAEQLWEKYIQDGFKKGAGRAFDDVNPSTRPDLFTPAEQESLRDFYNGTKQEFLRSAFAQPETIDKVKLLAGRTFDDLKGCTDDMATKLSRALSDGLIQGRGPRDIARDLTDQLDISENRAETIARTEIIRAHAEGQLEAFDKLGVTEIGVDVEWSTSGTIRVCPECAAMEGTIFSIEEAHGLIPYHPNCMCAFLPHNKEWDDEDKEDIARRRDEVNEELGLGVNAHRDTLGRFERWVGTINQAIQLTRNYNPNHDEHGRFSAGLGMPIGLHTPEGAKKLIEQ